MPTHATLDPLTGKVPSEQLPSSSVGGVSDHASLTGLLADDHTQYHTDARGDARYPLLGHTHGSSAVMTATQQSTSVTLANITQLVLPVVENAAYQITAFVTFQSAATTTGLNLGIDTPTGSRNMVEIVVPITSTAAASQLRTIFPNAAVATNAGNVVGTGVTAINSNHTAMITGVIRTGANAGVCQLKFASEVAGSAITLQIGSELQLVKIG